MNYLSQYNIPFHGLSDQEHVYNFVIKKEFFSFFDNSQIKSGDIDVEVSVQKRLTSLSLKFKLKGVVQVECDRCLDLYDQEIDFEEMLVAEFSDETNFDTNHDYVLLDKSESEMDISQFIYEYAHFALPIKHFHPNDENGEPMCNEDMLSILDNHAVVEEDVIDSRWAKLLEIKNNKS